MKNIWNLVTGVETIVGYNIITIDFNLFKEIYCEKYLDFERLFNNVNRDLATSNKNKKSNKFFDIKPIIHKLSEYLFDDCYSRCFNGKWSYRSKFIY